MRAVILAAGEGTRLRPFTRSGPKVMIPVANRPIIEYVVEGLVTNDIRDLVMVVGYKKERIMSHFEDGSHFNASIEYVVQRKQLGTAHALGLAEDKVQGDFVVLPGDNIVRPRAISELLGQKNGVAMLVCENEEPSKYGVVFMEDQKVVKIVEKPEFEMSNLISTGIYHFNDAIFKEIEEIRQFGKNDLTSVIQYLIKKKVAVCGVHTEDTWADAVHPWDLLRLNAMAMSGLGTGKAGTIESGVILKGMVRVGEGTVMRAGTYVQGPAVIGSGCDIGPNVCILPSTSIGDNVRIGPFTTVQNSLLMNDIVVGASSSIVNSVLGDGTSLGSHFMSGSGKAYIRSASEPTKSYEVNDIGAIIGSGAQIGYGVAAEPGAIVGANCRIASLSRVAGKLEDGSVKA